VLHAVAVGRADAHPDPLEGLLQERLVLRVDALDLWRRVVVEQPVVLPVRGAVAEGAVAGDLHDQGPAGDRDGRRLGARAPTTELDGKPGVLVRHAVC